MTIQIIILLLFSSFAIDIILFYVHTMQWLKQKNDD